MSFTESFFNAPPTVEIVARTKLVPFVLASSIVAGIEFITLGR